MYESRRRYSFVGDTRGSTVDSKKHVLLIGTPRINCQWKKYKRFVRIREKKKRSQEFVNRLLLQLQLNTFPRTKIISFFLYVPKNTYILKMLDGVGGNIPSQTFLESL